ncbi:hypothetical protein JQN72_16385 [Phycicoccus sp. CSK15P-2]|uniref:site-2 protease family protein n=1 Tax=Phycicoccus sp. CSK15P-2 TaxID=2807627 RepID=UPI00194E2AEF|nr:site-2 protease family protein [Phycicoccus sp. CSK15P-2]MBM6405823.1 hypothetical protein [Phycicoccus sp. CSK15P-2]
MSTAPPAPPGALRLGRVAGVPVFLDRTWLLLAVVIAFLGWQAGSGLGTGYALAYAAWLVVSIVVAVLGHEVGHAVTARILGFRVHRIVATVWGGHTAYDSTGATPGRTAAVALSGPAVNASLALLGGVWSSVVGGVASDFAWSFTLMNGILALFNLLPGLPLDGGAAVQSLVWAVTGRRDTGLQVAGRLGQVVAVGVVAWFLVRPLVRGDRPDLFDAGLALVMGWVLWSGATSAIRRARLERVIDTVHVGDVAQPAVVLPGETPLAEARVHDAVVVCEDEHGRPTLVLAAGEADAAGPTTPVGAVVTRIPDGNVVETGPEGSVGPVLRAMAGSRNGLVVLTREGSVWGVTSAGAVEAAASGSRRRT